MSRRLEILCAIHAESVTELTWQAWFDGAEMEWIK